MHAPSLWGLLIVLALAFLLFGRPGKLKNLMTDLGEGIRGFRKGLGDKPETADDGEAEEPPRRIVDQSGVREASPQRDKSGA